MASMTLKDWCKENNRMDLLAEWHPTKNGGLMSDSVTRASRKKVWWQCSECGYEWQAPVGNRTYNGSGCPMCMKKKMSELNIHSRIKKRGSLVDNYPDVAKEWHPTKNGETKASDVTCTSTKKVWWICSKGHEWQADVESRTLRSTGCPYCSGHSVLSGFNDLASVRPDIAKEWHPTKNGKLTPSEVTVGSGKKVWWRCQYGHEWLADIKGRTSHNLNCPKCSGSGTSLSEQGVAYYLEQICKVEQRKKFNGQEIDVYLPEYRIGVEYDGQFYHTDEKKNKEIYKNKKVADIGIVLIRIKESDKNFIADNIIYFKEDSLGNNYAWALNQLCQMLATLTGNRQFGLLRIDIDDDIVKIRQRIDLYHKEKSLLAMNPRIAKEWHPEKNGILTPEMFYEKSSVKVWWKCALGHEWQANISSRTFRDDGCPFCAGKKVLKGFNDLLTVNPKLAKEWHPTKNAELKASDITCGSNKKVWWKCQYGHEWQAAVCDRKNTQCPYCSGKRALSGFNDLRTVRPEIAREWHPTKNGTLTPEMFTVGSTTKIWWHCLECGNDWYVSVNNRTMHNTGCPECAKKKKDITRRKTLIMKYGSLAEKCPNVSKEWHPTKNADMKQIGRAHV